MFTRCFSDHGAARKCRYGAGSYTASKWNVANRLARVIYKILAGDKYKDIGYARACDHEDKIKMLINQLKALGVAIRHEGHEKIVSERHATINSTGVILN